MIQIDRCAQSAYTARLASPEEFHRSRDAWNTLVLAMHYPTVFSSWEWVTTWWRVFGSTRIPQLLLVHQGDCLKGILPLFSEHKWFRRNWMSGNVLGYAGSTDVYPDPLDIICAPNDVAQCMKAVSAYLADGSIRWDVLRLTYLAEDGNLMQWVKAQEICSHVAIQEASTSPYIPISGTYDNYLSTLSSNERQKIRNRKRKFLERGGGAYVEFRHDDYQSALVTLFELHDRRASQKKIRSSFTGPSIERFHRELLGCLSPEQIWMRGLRLGNKNIAVFYGFYLSGRVFYYQLGYDPECSSMSPGIVLLQETIREAFDRGLTEYSFLQGGEGFKYHWTNQQRILYHSHLYNQTWCGRSSRLARQLRNSFKRVYQHSFLGTN